MLPKRHQACGSGPYALGFYFGSASCLAYVLLCKFILLKIKSLWFDYDLLSTLKASVLLPSIVFPRLFLSGFVGPELKRGDKNMQQVG